jgi:hypothetical protein
MEQPRNILDTSLILAFYRGGYFVCRGRGDDRAVVFQPFCGVAEHGFAFCDRMGDGHDRKCNAGDVGPFQLLFTRNGDVSTQNVRKQIGIVTIFLIGRVIGAIVEN